MADSPRYTTEELHAVGLAIRDDLSERGLDILPDLLSAQGTEDDHYTLYVKPKGVMARGGREGHIEIHEFLRGLCGFTDQERLRDLSTEEMQIVVGGMAYIADYIAEGIIALAGEADPEIDPEAEFEFVLDPALRDEIIARRKRIASAGDSDG